MGYALLGLLARESFSGYGLTKTMEERVRFFWRARHSQVYPELARLEEEGMVSFEAVEQKDRPDKKVYSITDAGLEALKEWVTRPVAPRAARDELVLKAYSSWLADPEAAVALFREEQRRHEEQLAEYEEIDAWMRAEWGEDIERASSPRFSSYASLQRGIGYERGYAEWCRWMSDRLEAEPGETGGGA